MSSSIQTWAVIGFMESIFIGLYVIIKISTFISETIENERKHGRSAHRRPATIRNRVRSWLRNAWPFRRSLGAHVCQALV